MELNPSYLKPGKLLGLFLLVHETFLLIYDKWMRKEWHFMVERRAKKKKDLKKAGVKTIIMLFNMAYVEDLHSYEVKNEVGDLERTINIDFLEKVRERIIAKEINNW